MFCFFDIKMYFFTCIMIFLLIILFILFLFTYFYLMDEPCLRTFFRTFKRDFRELILYSKIHFFVKYCQIRNLTLVDYFNKNVEKNPDKVCFVFEDEEWTYKQVDDLSNKIACCFIEQTYKKGDEVALLLENCPDYICIWLGLAKIGVVTALINTNNKINTLAHSLNIIDMKGLIFGQNFAETVQKTMPFIQNASNVKFYSYARQLEEKLIMPFRCEFLHELLFHVPADILQPKEFKMNVEDKVLYMYTSGTTGLPKIAVITHKRYTRFMGALKYTMNANEIHTFYNALPLYHITGGFEYTIPVLVFCHKMVLRRKFSASKFWKEVVKHNVTVCFYIGEICRYLLNQPEIREETQHSLQIMVGSGLKPHLWKEIQKRFNIRKIIEHYGSTEGNTHIVNYYDKVGAVGIISRIFFRIQGTHLIKVHEGTGKIMRDSKGLCIRCKPGEPGQLVTEIVPNNPLKEFEGYLNTEDTETKIVRNCFSEKDIAYLTGDILVMDEDGYLYFKHRLGDTFRRKGENISSVEVEDIISKALNSISCVVYGVEIPGIEGQVGMAALQFENLKDFNFEKLYECISQSLPSYAMPVFFRISCGLEITGTYKLKKGGLKQQGYNPKEIDDPLYVLDTKRKRYTPLTTKIFSDIMSGATIL